MIIVLYIMWIMAAVSMVAGFAPMMREAKLWEKICVAALVLLGAPFMLITQGIESVLAFLLPEGWDDNDNKFGC